MRLKQPDKTKQNSKDLEKSASEAKAVPKVF